MMVEERVDQSVCAVWWRAMELLPRSCGSLTSVKGTQTCKEPRQTSSSAPIR